MRVERRHPGRRPRASFTLIELLVTMGIIAIVSAITVVSVRSMARDARLSSAVNTVVAALDSARALAVKRDQVVLVVFRAILEGEQEQVIEVVTTEWGGDRYPVFNANFSQTRFVDRFVPIPDVPVRTLPRGMKVAAPLYAGNVDTKWLASSDLPAVRRDEWAGGIVGVMYASDGTRVTQNPATLADLAFVDFGNDTLDIRDIRQTQGVTGDGGPWERRFIISDHVDNGRYCDIGDDGVEDLFPFFFFFCQAAPDDEPYIILAPFLAVYDDDDARDIRVTDWSDTEEYAELVGSSDPNSPYHGGGYITERADRIHFNRYTGVIMR